MDRHHALQDRAPRTSIFILCAPLIRPGDPHRLPSALPARSALPTLAIISLIHWSLVGGESPGGNP
jgi:hypothetical protein